MQRLTTPTHIFKMKENPNGWDKFRITYNQNGRTILEKTEQDAQYMTIVQDQDTYILQYALTQEESKRFTKDVMAKVQIKAHYPNGKVIASKKFDLSVEDVLNKEIL